jgi:hypothetical protein
MYRPSHRPSFDCPDIIWQEEQIVKLHILQFSPVSCTSCPSCPYIPRSTLFSNTPSLYFFSINVGEQILNSHKTAGKIAISAESFQMEEGTRNTLN